MTALATGRRTELRHYTDDDADDVSQLLCDPTILSRFWGPGSPPGADRLASLVGRPGLCLVARGRSGRFLGLCLLNDLDFKNGTARATVAVQEAVRRSGLGLEAFCLVVTFAFFQFPLRKIYAEVLEESLESFSKVPNRFAQVEGRLEKHIYSSGRYQDVFLLAFWRQAWTEPDKVRDYLLGR